MSARSWFNSLATGDERAAVSSITDQTFLRLFLHLCSKSDKEGNLPLSLEEITALYQQSTANPTVVTTSNGTSSSANGKASISDKPPADDSEPRTPMKEPKSSTTGDSCAPAFANASPCDSELSIKTEPPTPSDEDKISKLLSMLLSHVCAMLPSAFSSEVVEIEKWLKNGDGSSSGGKKKNKGRNAQNGESKERVSSDDGPLVALALDPTILGVLRGGSMFYNLADKVVGLLKEEDDQEKSDDVERFLIDAPSDVTKSMWPAWLVQGSTKEQKQMNLGLILLAGFEMAITASHQRSTQTVEQLVDVGDIMLHIGGESSLHKVWKLNPSSGEADTASKLAKEIEQIFLLRTLLKEDGEKLRTLVSGEEWSQFESSFEGFDGAFQTEHLVVTPLQWLLSSSSAGESCRDWKNSIAGIWSKIASHLNSVSKTNDKKQEEGRDKDFGIDGEALASPARKKKKKSKKKNKKKSSNLDADSQKEGDQKEQQADPVKQSDVPVKKSDKPPPPAVKGEKSNNSPVKAVIDKTPAKTCKSSESQEQVDSTSNSSQAATKSDEAATKPAPTNKQPESKSFDVTSIHEKSQNQADNEEENKPNDDADEWETVAVKTRKPKAKQTNDQANNSKSNNGNRSSQSSSGRNNNNGSSNHGEGGNKRHRDKKKNRKDKGEKDNNRRRNQPNNQTSVVKDVLTHILDVVDDEVSKRKQGVKSVASDDRRRSANSDKRSPATANNSRSNTDQRRKSQATPVPSSTDSNSKQQPRSLRDVVAGVTPTSGKSSDTVPQNGDQSKKSAPEPPRDAKIKPGLSYKSVIEPTRQQTPAVVTPTTTNEAKAPEKTVKAGGKENSKSKSASAAACRRDASSSSAQGKTKGTAPLETETNCVAAKEDSCQLPASTTEEDRNTPPLSTLLGPGTSCSATSSVASSLEAPHSSRFRHQSIASTEDVGVHLLNVCKQLSEEIDTFMSRRSLALDVRRKERSAVLGALQDTLVKIWPGNCHVEMYGSCATQLDLPSSDLDLVVCGLDEMMMNHIPIDHATGSIMPSPDSSSMNLHSPSPSESAQNLQHQQSFENGSQKLHQSFENSVHTLPHSPAEIAHEHQTPNQQEFNSSFAESNADEVTEFVPENGAGMVYEASEEDVTMGMEGYNLDYHGNQQEYYYVPYNYMPPMSLNAQRVIRLASELEMQPWAVQVKAIPTAAVPVVKILADPSKLPGAVGTGDNWIIAAQAGAPGTPPLTPEQIPSTPNQFSASSHFFAQPTMPSWRGADIMNGLQPVDITFEGPEHGGIGSTTYSACVVQDACIETGLSPDKTPVVQVKMVLKELLAQRRLNEPFTGGLSSYALLLLLLAVVKERQIIQEEMERVEKQRQEVNQPDTRDNKPPQKQQNNTGPRLSAAQIVAGKSNSAKPSFNNKKNDAPPTTDASNNAHAISKEKPEVEKKQVSSSSWASIAKKSNGSTARTDSMSTATISNSSSLVTKRNANDKSEALQSSSKDEAKQNVPHKASASSPTLVQSGSTMNSAETESEPAQGKVAKTLPQSKVTLEGQAPLTSEEELKPPLIPQCSNDVLEVLCSGELTAGKLLMHFLLFYGQHFDAQSTLIDVNGTHHPEYGTLDLEKLSPFVTRPPGGNIDPITGMYSVDPIVVYDPLEGAMDHNVAKRCYCWNNVKWVFAQSYMTVSSIVETSGTSSKTVTKERSRREKKTDDSATAKKSGAGDPSSKEQSSASRGDIVSPILELLLSF